MPFVSKKQERWAFSNKKKLAKKGFDVEEWAKKTTYKELPEEIRQRDKKQKKEGKQ
jgi:hypothetical protein